MNQYLKTLGVGLAGKLIDFGVAKITSPHKTTPQERIEQINRTLETLESAPEVGQHWTTPLVETPESQKEGASTEKTSTIQAPTKAPKTVATACVPCALGHFSTSSGVLNEIARFKKDGITSNEILDRIAKVQAEQNALERVDLAPENIQALPSWEKDLAEDALSQSRMLRHSLESFTSIEQLEQAAADTSVFYKELNRRWFKGRFSHLRPEKAERIADKVSRLSPEEKEDIMQRVEELAEVS